MMQTESGGNQKAGCRIVAEPRSRIVLMASPKKFRELPDCIAERGAEKELSCVKQLTRPHQRNLLMNQSGASLAVPVTRAAGYVPPSGRLLPEPRRYPPRRGSFSGSGRGPMCGRCLGVPAEDIVMSDRAGRRPLALLSQPAERRHPQHRIVSSALAYTGRPKSAQLGTPDSYHGLSSSR
jgi:hypothetical protein